MTNAEPVHRLENHPDAETLQAFDHPGQDLHRWKAALTAKAWMGAELACFFVGRDDERRFVLLFRPGNDYRPLHHGEDMRLAAVGEIYDLDVVGAQRAVPLVEAADRIEDFP